MYGGWLRQLKCKIKSKISFFKKVEDNIVKYLIQQSHISVKIKRHFYFFKLKLFYNLTFFL